MHSQLREIITKGYRNKRRQARLLTVNAGRIEGPMTDAGHYVLSPALIFLHYYFNHDHGHVFYL